LKHTIQALVDAERARQHRRIQGAEAELKKLRSQPTPAEDGDADGSHATQIRTARHIDRAELELERAKAAAEALKHLWVRLEEELASEQADPSAIQADLDAVRGR
jgi:Skp family chaperone for outer membrane proteins